MGNVRYGPKPRIGKFNVVDYKNQAYGVYWQGKTKEIEDNLGICNYVGTWSGANFMDISDFVDITNAGMGLKLSEKDLMEHYAPIGRNLEKAFNTLHTDLSREDDVPPQRFIKEEVKTGPYKGSKIDRHCYNKMLEELYHLWEWDEQTGLQTRTGLLKLGLNEVVELLAQKNKLIEK